MKRVGCAGRRGARLRLGQRLRQQGRRRGARRLAQGPRPCTGESEGTAAAATGDAPRVLAPSASERSPLCAACCARAIFASREVPTVLGDNEDVSIDSAMLGSVAGVQNVASRPLLRVLPLSRFGMVK